MSEEPDLSRLKELLAKIEANESDWKLITYYLGHVPALISAVEASEAKVARLEALLSLVRNFIWESPSTREGYAETLAAIDAALEDK